MASGGSIERLACAETVLFCFAIRERKPTVCIALKNRNTVGMRVHHRLLVSFVVVSEHAHLLIFDFHLVMFRVYFDWVLNFHLGFRSCRHDFLLCVVNAWFTEGDWRIVRGNRKGQVVVSLL